jgi:hypothetical protein
MAQTESHAESSSLSDLIQSRSAAMPKMGFERLAEGQTELLEDFERHYRNWIDRMQSEAALASEFTTKLSAGSSAPASAAVWQEWASRRVDVAAEDTRRLFADCQAVRGGGSALVVSSMSNGELIGRHNANSRVCCGVIGGEPAEETAEAQKREKYIAIKKG